MKPNPTIEEPDVQILLHHIRNDRNNMQARKRAYRDAAMVLLMLDAGLRVGELVQLTQANLFIGFQPVTALHVPDAIAKRGNARTIPLSARALTAIADLATYFWTVFRGHPDYFAFYRHSPRAHITTRQVERIIKASAFASLGRPLHPHALRHTFADNLRKVTDMPTVQQLLGHKHLSSTQVYMHSDLKDATDAIAQMQQAQ